MDLIKVIKDLNAGKIKKLNLTNSNITLEEIKKLSEVLKHNTSLEQLELCNNEIGLAAAPFIGDIIRHNSSLKKLNLSSNKLCSEGVIYIAKALEQNTVLQVLGLGGNKVSNKGAIRLAEALKVNQTLKELILAYNWGINDKGILPFKEILVNHAKLSKLNLRKTKVSDEVQALLDSLLVQKKVSEPKSIASSTLKPLSSLGKFELLEEEEKKTMSYHIGYMDKSFRAKSEFSLPERLQENLSTHLKIILNQALVAGIVEGITEASVIQLKADGDCLFNAILLGGKLVCPVHHIIHKQLNHLALRRLISPENHFSATLYREEIFNELRNKVTMAESFEGESLRGLKGELAEEIDSKRQAYQKAKKQKVKQRLLVDLEKQKDHLFKRYIKMMQQGGAWGGEHEIDILARVLNIKITLTQEGRIFNDHKKIPEIELFYTGEHYNIILSGDMLKKLRKEERKPAVIDSAEIDGAQHMLSKASTSKKQRKEEKQKFLERWLRIKGISRAVYLEAGIDAKFYKSIYFSLKDFFMLPMMSSTRIKLSFYPAAQLGEEGGYKAVLQRLSHLSAGWLANEGDIYKYAYGIIDRDYDINYKFLANNGLDKKVVVLPRHSLENFVFDPFVICSVLTVQELRDFINSSKLIAGYERREELIRVCTHLQALLVEKQSGIHHRSFEKKIQKILEAYFRIVLGTLAEYYDGQAIVFASKALPLYQVIRKKIKANRQLCNTEIAIACAYGKQIKISYPKEFLEIRGHDIESFFTGDQEESRYITSKIVSEIHNNGLYYMPLDLIELFRNLNSKIKLDSDSLGKIITPKPEKIKFRKTEKRYYSDAVKTGEANIYKYDKTSYFIFCYKRYPEPITPKKPKTKPHHISGSVIDQLGLKQKRDEGLLQLTNCGINNKDVKKIAEVLGKCDRVIHKLAMGHNFITDRGCFGLGDIIGHNYNLRFLDLSHNLISGIGLIKIAAVLQKHPALEEVNVSENALGNKGAIIIAKILSENRKITYLNLAGNKISSEGCTALADSLLTNSSLRILIMERNSIKDMGADAISDMLAINTTLKLINLNYNSIGIEGITSIANSIQPRGQISNGHRNELVIHR
jgi:Ran GTPase-activating protein (RanGAP) involved in mRNA processing and transport